MTLEVCTGDDPFRQQANARSIRALLLQDSWWDDGAPICFKAITVAYVFCKLGNIPRKTRGEMCPSLDVQMSVYGKGRYFRRPAQAKRSGPESEERRPDNPMHGSWL